jgi:hypothetical protein
VSGRFHGSRYGWPFDTVWASTPSQMYLGNYWVSRYLKTIAPGWSLLAVAPCND